MCKRVCKGESEFVENYVGKLHLKMNKKFSTKVCAKVSMKSVTNTV